MSKRPYTEYDADSSITTVVYSDSESEEERPMEEIHHETIHWGPNGRARRETTFSQIPGLPTKKKGVRQRAFDVLGPDLPPIAEVLEPDEDNTHEGYAFDDGHPAATAPRPACDSVSFLLLVTPTWC
jgi:hypothetical protein